MQFKLQRRRGSSLIFSCIAVLMLCVLAGFAVDFASVLLVRSQLQQTADAAALAGATNMVTKDRTKTVTQARNDAIQAAAKNIQYFKNLTDPSNPLALKTSDVSVTKSKSTLPYYDTVEVSLKRAIPLQFVGYFGVSSYTVEAKATARFVAGAEVEETVYGNANPYLAGMPPGSKASLNNPHNSPDIAGDITKPNRADWKQSPKPIGGMPIVPGQYLTFDSIAGQTKHDPNEEMIYPDGETGENGAPWDIGTNTAGAENGISQLRAPINALVGVFLGPDRPNLTAPPPMLDYLTSESRNKTVYEPQLKQIFFIGDGLTNEGVRQQFKVPEGATRLFLATWDFYEWNNNAGQRDVRIIRPSKVYLIK